MAESKSRPSKPSPGRVIPSVARNLALVCGGRTQGEIPRYARNDTGLKQAIAKADEQGYVVI
jgi:hypothetical protein